MPTGADAKHWRVSEVAERAHVTVRTLHHYDGIGLLVPSGRSEAGYRLYSEADLERLFRILLYRELGFPLEAIARVIDDPTVDRGAALRAQRELLVERRRRTDAVIRAVDRALATLEGGTEMSGDEILDGLDAFASAPEEIRAHIGRWFYPCSYAIHAGLADMYEADPPYTAHYEAQAPGLAAFVAAAIRANAKRARDGGREE